MSVSPNTSGLPQEAMGHLVGQAYINQGLQNLAALNGNVAELISKKKLPQKRWTDQQIELFLHQISMMDSNNFSGNSGVGEREGRCFSALVARRNYNLCHGIGRSGDISEVQPKAAGSSLVLKLTNQLAQDAIKVAGIKTVKESILLPLATGMAICFCFTALRESRPKAKFVIFLRIDQKACFKAIFTAGYIPIIVNGIQNGDEIQTNLEQIEYEIKNHGHESILCVLSTTSCFAPRVSDNLPEVGKICKQHDIPHIVNNAYGLQSTKCSHLISETHRLGFRIDGFVQSMDKNFGVPVGGSIVAGFGSGLTAKIGAVYPGRASAAPVIDLFITFLSLGVEGYKKLLSDRKLRFAELKNEVAKLSNKRNDLRLLHTPHNDISMGIGFSRVSETLDKVTGVELRQQEPDFSVTKFGSMLFTRFVSGARVVPIGNQKVINGVKFQGYGSHVDCYSCDYLTVAAAIGIEVEDIELFIKRFDRILTKKLPCLKGDVSSDASTLENQKAEQYHSIQQSLEQKVEELNLS